MAYGMRDGSGKGRGYMKPKYSTKNPDYINDKRERAKAINQKIEDLAKKKRIKYGKEQKPTVEVG